MFGNRRQNWITFRFQQERQRTFKILVNNLHAYWKNTGLSFLGSLLLCSPSLEDLITSRDVRYIYNQCNYLHIWIYFWLILCFLFVLTGNVVLQVFFFSCLLLNWFFSPHFIFFPSTSLEVTNFVFILLVATSEIITCTFNLSNSEINQPLSLEIQRYLRTL